MLSFLCRVENGHNNSHLVNSYEITRLCRWTTVTDYDSQITIFLPSPNPTEDKQTRFSKRCVTVTYGNGQRTKH
jgi:hypothetical protein